MADELTTPRELLRELLDKVPSVTGYAVAYADYLAIGDVEPQHLSDWTRREHEAANEAARLLRHEWSRRVWKR